MCWLRDRSDEIRTPRYLCECIFSSGCLLVENTLSSTFARLGQIYISTHEIMIRYVLSKCIHITLQGIYRSRTGYSLLCKVAGHQQTLLYCLHEVVLLPIHLCISEKEEAPDLSLEVYRSTGADLTPSISS